MKISIKQYSQTLFELTNGKSEQEILNIIKKFVEQLKIDGQLKNSTKIIENFSEIFNAENGIIEAKIVTRREMDSEMIENLKKIIKEKYSAKEVVISTVIDEAVMGGIVIRVGDEIIDGSVSAQLKRLKHILSK